MLGRKIGALPTVLLDPEAQLLEPGASDRAFADRLEGWWARGRPAIRCRQDLLVNVTAREFLGALRDPGNYTCHV